ncbi:hypothetical protein [Mycolicibacter virginiensis]|nr:hypothetical protein [Mycolicibacter virginiensis]UVI51755.1 hypothetical protein MJO54_23595 [Mycolicibacter virginiensis]
MTADVPVVEPTPELLALLRISDAQIAAGQVQPRPERPPRDRQP